MAPRSERTKPGIRHLRVVLGVAAALISLLLSALACVLIAVGLVGPTIAEEPATAADFWLVVVGLVSFVWALCLFVSSVSLAEGRANARRLALAMAPVVAIGVVLPVGPFPAGGPLSASATIGSFAVGVLVVWCGVVFLGFTDPERWTTAGPPRSRLLHPPTARYSAAA